MDAALNYPYYKIRKDFGRQPMFCEVPVNMIDSINLDKGDQKLYCLRNPVNRDIQASINLSEHHINTKRVTPHDQGVNHGEGGWPKDIIFNDEEATIRYRRRFERDDAYVDAVMNLYPQFEHFIRQNNAIEMYNMYFKEMKEEDPVERYSICINNIFKDPNSRPVSSIDWTYEDDSKLVVAYCNKMYPVSGDVNKELSFFLWDIENPKEPITVFLPPSSCWQIVCSPSHHKIVIGGLSDGRVCIFDIRDRMEPVALSPMHLAHRNPVSSLVFMQSRLNNEFFCGSSDGQCMWWDVRNINQPLETLIMSVKNTPGDKISLANAEPISSLQFDRSFPTKFLCGTDTGLVVNVNRKGKNDQEVMSAIFQAHNGPVKAVQRSPCASKFFITCGDWVTRIWSEDIHSSPIITSTVHRKQISDVVWAPQRFSSYMTICNDGKFRYWDLLRKYRDPIFVLPLSKYPLLKLKPNEEGKHIAVGNSKGMVSLLSLSDSLVVSGPRDKQLMSQRLERESRREHILETRIKEIRLKLKTDGNDDLDTNLAYDETVIKAAEDEYKRMVLEELRQTEISHHAGGKSFKSVNIRTR